MIGLVNLLAKASEATQHRDIFTMMIIGVALLISTYIYELIKLMEIITVSDKILSLTI